MQHRLLTPFRCVFVLACLSLGGMACQQPDGSFVRTPFAGFGSRFQAQDAKSFRETEQLAYIRLPSRFLTADFIRETGFNRDHVRDDVFSFGYISRTALSQLPNEVFAELIELDAQSWSKHRFNPRTLEILNSDVDTTFNANFEDYHNYAALTQELQATANRYPEITQLESIGKSENGRELWLMKLSARAKIDEAEPKLLYIANMHGDEVVGRELMLYLIRQLTSEYASNPRIKHLLDHNQIYIMPSMNPDGFELQQRYNARGVDLNRDFPDFTSDPHDTPNRRAAETVAVMQLHEKHHFVVAVNFHGGDVCFNIPWDTQANNDDRDKFGDDALMQLTAHRYAELNPTMRNNSGGSFDHGVTYGYEWYEVDGGMQDWHNYYRSGIHATVELSYTKWPAAAKLPKFWEENQEALLSHLEEASFGVHLHVTDESGQAISQSSVRLASADRDVAYRGAYITRPSIPGMQSVTVRAPGYQAATVQIAATQFDGNYYELVLKR